MGRAKSLDEELLALVGDVPAGVKFPLSRFARELNCSTSVVISGLAALVMSGAIDEASMRAPVDPRSRRGKRPLGEVTDGFAVIAEVKPFLDHTGMPTTSFGAKALNDPGAWARWKRGSTVRPRTLTRVREFIANYVPPEVSTVARPRLPKAGSELPSGADLSREIDRYCERAGIKRGAFATLAGLSGIQIARMRSMEVRAVTVAKVRAVIASGGKSARELGFSRREVSIRPSGNRPTIDEVEVRRRQHQGAIDGRQPGETVADAVAREAKEAGERRNNARWSKGARAIETSCAANSQSHAGETSRERFARLAAEVDAELNSDEAIAREARENRELDELVSPSSVLRRAQRDWPGQCERVKAIAAELGVSLGEAWRRVIGAGVDCLSEADA